MSKWAKQLVHLTLQPIGLAGVRSNPLVYLQIGALHGSFEERIGILRNGKVNTSKRYSNAIKCIYRHLDIYWV